MAAIGKAPSKDKYPHLARYYSHITSLSEAAKAKCVNLRAASCNVFVFALTDRANVVVPGCRQA